MKPDKEPVKSDAPEDGDDAASTGQTPVDPETEGVDARDDPEKLKENRDRLGVDEEHKTPDMQEGHRGTFP